MLPSHPNDPKTTSCLRRGVRSGHAGREDPVLQAGFRRWAHAGHAEGKRQGSASGCTLTVHAASTSLQGEQSPPCATHRFETDDGWKGGAQGERPCERSGRALGAHGERCTLGLAIVGSRFAVGVAGDGGPGTAPESRLRLRTAARSGQDGGASAHALIAVEFGARCAGGSRAEAHTKVVVRCVGWITYIGGSNGVLPAPPSGSLGVPVGPMPARAEHPAKTPNQSSENNVRWKCMTKAPVQVGRDCRHIRPYIINN